MSYSWKGARGKNTFHNFKIVNLIIGKTSSICRYSCFLKLTIVMMIMFIVLYVQYYKLIYYIYL